MEREKKQKEKGNEPNFFYNETNIFTSIASEQMEDYYLKTFAKAGVDFPVNGTKVC